MIASNFELGFVWGLDGQSYSEILDCESVIFDDDLVQAEIEQRIGFEFGLRERELDPNNNVDF